MNKTRLAAYAVLLGGFLLTPGRAAAYQGGALKPHSHSSSSQGGATLSPATLTTSGRTQHNGPTKVSSTTFIVDGAGASVTLPNITLSAGVVFPVGSTVTFSSSTTTALTTTTVNNFVSAPGQWIPLGSIRPVTAKSFAFTFPALALGDRLRLNMTLTAAGAAGHVAVTFNDDELNYHTHGFVITSAGTSALNAPTTECGFMFNTGLVAVGGLLGGEMILYRNPATPTTTGATSMSTVADSGGDWREYMGGCQYVGAATLTTITVSMDTAGASMTGYASLELQKAL